MASLAFGLHSTQRTLASEFQPFSGDVIALVVFGGLLVFAVLGWIQHPALEIESGLLAGLYLLGAWLQSRPFLG